MNNGQAMDTFGQVDSTGRAGCATAQPAQPPPMGYLLPDREPPPWNPEQELFFRWRRRVRCEGMTP